MPHSPLVIRSLAGELLPEEMDELDADPDADAEPHIEPVHNRIPPSLPHKNPSLSGLPDPSQQLHHNHPTGSKRPPTPTDNISSFQKSSRSHPGQSQNESKRRRTSAPSWIRLAPSSESTKVSTPVASGSTSQPADICPASHEKAPPSHERPFSVPRQLSKGPSTAGNISTPPTFKVYVDRLPGTNTPPKSLPNKNVIEEDEEDIEVILDGPVEEDPFFSPEGGGQSHGDRRDSEHSSNDDGYSSWHGVDSSDSEATPSTSPAPPYRSLITQARRDLVVKNPSPPHAGSSPLNQPMSISTSSFRPSTNRTTMPRSSRHHMKVPKTGEPHPAKPNSQGAPDSLRQPLTPHARSSSPKDTSPTPLPQAAFQSILKTVTLNRATSAAINSPLPPCPPVPYKSDRRPSQPKASSHSQHIQKELPNDMSDREDSAATGHGHTNLLLSPLDKTPIEEGGSAGDELWEKAHGGDGASRSVEPDGQHVVDISTIRSVFKARGKTPLREDLGEFGRTTEPHTGYAGFSSRFYPDRDRALQIPSGELTKEAAELRWAGISSAEVVVVKEYEDSMHAKLPRACRDIIKGTSRANFDPEAQRWLACRIKVLSEFPERTTEKADFISSVVQEFFYRFADLHPSNLFLKDDIMERTYIEKIKMSLRSRASELKSKQQSASTSIHKAVAAYMPFLDKALHRETPTRPADLFFEEEGMREATKPLWDEHWAELKPQLIESEGSEEVANRFRISSYMSWRSWFFYDSGYVPKDVQDEFDEFIAAAASNDRSGGLEPSEVFEKGLPLINNLMYEFSKRTGIPFMLVMTWPDPEHSGQIQTMLQTGRGQASTEVSDFRHSSSFVDSELLPRWRAYAGRVFEVQEDAPHAMYEHVSPDDAAECPEGSAPTISGYAGPIDLTTEVKVTKARAELLKYLGDRWCRANNRQRANYDQIQLDINDRVPKPRLPKATRSIEIERVLPDGNTVMERVQRVVAVPYTKITTMPIQDFMDWLHHLADPSIPPENQFFFSAELRRAKDAGASMPITVQHTFGWPEEGSTRVAGSSRTADAPAQEPDGPGAHASKLKRTRQKSNQPKTKPGLGNAKTKAKAIYKARRKGKKGPVSEDDDDDNTDAVEEFQLPDSDDGDDLPESTLAQGPTKGSRKSERIKGKAQTEGTADKRIEPSREGPTPDVPSVPSSHKDKTPSAPQQQRLFLSSVRIMTPSRRLPRVFSLSPPADPLDVSTVGQVNASLVKAKSYLQNLPPPDFPCNGKETGLYAPKSAYEILSLLSLLDSLFPNRPSIYYPGFRNKTITTDPPVAALETAVSQQVWTPLNNPDAAIPMATTVNRLCSSNPEYAHKTFESAYIYASQIFDGLRERDLLSPDKQVYSATSVFSILCRYIVFIGRHPKLFRKVPVFIDALCEWATVLITVTYAVHATQSALIRYQHDEDAHRFSSTMAISTLLTAFLKSLYRYISGRQYILADVVAGEFLYLSFERPPCFSLSNPTNRWFTAVPSENLENLVWKFFERRLDVETDVFQSMPIVCQMELLTVVFATHNFKVREADEEETWMAWLELLESSILGLELERPDDQETIKDTAVDTTSSTPRKRANSPPLLPDPKTPHSIPISSPRRGSSIPQAQPDSSPAPRQPPESARETDRNTPEVEGRFGPGHIDQPLVPPSVQAATTDPVTSDASAGENTVKPRSPPPPPASSTSAQSPENGSTNPVLNRTSAAPSRWRPGDKARVIISKKLRDVEIIQEDGELRMRDSQTGKVLLNRYKSPKPLPPFDQLLLYDRLPLNAPHKMARFHVYSRNAPPSPTVDDPRTWEPFLPADEEFDPEEVRAGWDKPLAEISKVKETVVDNGSIPVVPILPGTILLTGFPTFQVFVGRLGRLLLRKEKPKRE